MTYLCIGKTDKDMLKRKIDSYLEQFSYQKKCLNSPVFTFFLEV